MSKKTEMDVYKVLRFPLATEKVIRKIEFDNTLTFVVHPKATKQAIAAAVEKLFQVKVSDVNVHHSMQGQKRAIVRLDKKNSAADVSADLGLI